MRVLIELQRRVRLMVAPKLKMKRENEAAIVV